MNMRKICLFMVILLYAAICHAQTFVSASEMLEMIQMETYQANQYMRKKAGYKKIKLGDYSTGYYKGCSAEGMCLATNTSQVWMELKNIKVGVSTGVTVNNEPGDLDSRNIEAVVYGKKSLMVWQSQLKQLGYKLTKWQNELGIEEWTYKKENVNYAFHLMYIRQQNGYCRLTVWDPYYLHPGGVSF